MIAFLQSPTFNKTVLAAGIILVPTTVFWLVVAIHATVGIDSVMRPLMQMEMSPGGSVVLVTVVLGCPFFALPLAAIGRWLAKVQGQRGKAFGMGVMLVSTFLIVLGVVLPLIFR
jgi:hypothetical protein